jgi:hypothetical protein
MSGAGRCDLDGGRSDGFGANVDGRLLVPRCTGGEALSSSLMSRPRRRYSSSEVRVFLSERRAREYRKHRRVVSVTKPYSPHCESAAITAMTREVTNLGMLSAISATISVWAVPSPTEERPGVALSHFKRQVYDNR